MKKNKTSSKLELNYEKVFRNTLDWCPLFGYLPDISNSSIAKNPIIIYYDEASPTKGFPAYDVANTCLKIIKEAREYWDIAHHDLVKYDPWPEVQKLPTKKDAKGQKCEYSKDGQKIHKARKLFQNVHRLTWGSWPVDDPRSSTRRTMPPKYDVLTIESDSLLASATCCLGTDFDGTYLDEIYSIFMIHEAWCLLHGVLLNKYKKSDIQLVHASLDYIDEIRKGADIRRRMRQLADYKQKHIQGSSSGGKNKINTFLVACKQLIDIKHGRTNPVSTWDYFMENHKSKNKALKCGSRYVHWKKSESDRYPDGFLIELNKERNETGNRNTFESFCRNFSKAKSEINNKII